MEGNRETRPMTPEENANYWNSVSYLITSKCPGCSDHPLLIRKKQKSDHFWDKGVLTCPKCGFQLFGK